MTNSNNINNLTTPLNPYYSFRNRNSFRNHSSIEINYHLVFHKINDKLKIKNLLYNNDKIEEKVTIKNNKNNLSVQVLYFIYYSKRKNQNSCKQNIIHKENNYFFVDINKKEENKEINNVKYNDFIIDKQKIQIFKENNIAKIMMNKNLII